jgi:signal transduction histidine kinase
MLHEFVALYRDAIITRTREKLTNRPWPLASTSELENGVPIFLTQLCETLSRGITAETEQQADVATSATRHGAELFALGFNLSQVVHDYGDLCQAITEIAVEHNAPITVAEFHTLNRSLDTATAEAVTEHARITALTRSNEEVERSGQMAHEIRDMLNTAVFAFQALQRGTVAINGSTGAVLGRSLMGLRDLVDSSLADIRLAANHQRRAWTSVSTLLHDIATSAALHAQYRGLQFAVDTIDPELAINVDPQLLASAVMNLLNNAIKYTKAGGRVILRAHREGSAVCIEVEDQCGGIPDTLGDPFQPFADQRGNDRTGLGLGLSIARKAVRAHGGDIQIRNTPGHGCVFIIEVPLAGDEMVKAGEQPCRAASPTSARG